MTANLDALVRDLAAAEGIPARHVPAVLHRAKMAQRAVAHVDGHDVLGAGLRVLARRVVRGAVLDHEAGRLEVRA